MVIPWVGFPLAALIKQAEPLGSAKFVEFVTQMEPDAMPGLNLPYLDLALYRRFAAGWTRLCIR
jgi:sulfoxide reductase catalytic subunit YedY